MSDSPKQAPHDEWLRDYIVDFETTEEPDMWVSIEVEGEDAEDAIERAVEFLTAQLEQPDPGFWQDALGRDPKDGEEFVPVQVTIDTDAP